MEATILVKTKICTACRQEKPVSEFDEVSLIDLMRSQQTDGYITQCKQCIHNKRDLSREHYRYRRWKARIKLDRQINEQKKWLLENNFPKLSSLDQRYLIEVFKELAL